MNSVTSVFSVVISGVVVLTVALCTPSRARAASPSQLRSRKLVPARFTNRTDALGFNWDFNQQTGQINHGTNYAFRHAVLLQVNGTNFNCSRPMMTSDGSEYVLTSSSIRGVEITRRVTFDSTSSTVRYVDSFKNAGASPVALTVTLHTQISTNCQVVMSDTGANSPSALDKKGCGILAMQRPQYGRPSGLFYLAAPKSKLKPSISNQNNQVLQFIYNLKVPPRRTVSLLHGIAQRRLGNAPHPKTLAGMFKPFLSRKWTRGIPSDIRRTIVNARGLGPGFGGGNEFVSLERLGVVRGSQDVLALGDETRLTGIAACAHLTIRTRYGATTVPFERVAALVGAKCRRSAPRVYLRSGEVLGGEIEARDLRFTLSSGLAIDLEVDTLDRLVTAAAPADGTPGEKTVAWVETVAGERLALVRSAAGADPPAGGEPPRISAATPWGRREVVLTDVRSIRTAAPPALGHVVALRDGSRFVAFLEDRALELETFLFGPVAFEPTKILSITAMENGEAEDDAPEQPEGPHVVLVGDNVLAGRIDLPRIEFVSFGEVIPVPPEQIRAMHNASGDVEGPARAGALFTAEVWAGGVVAGVVAQPVLPVRVSGEVWHIPVRDVVGAFVPTPTVPVRLRKKIARLIRDLGHAEWETREAATAELEDIGYLAKQQLSEAIRSTTDPEVRRRAQGLIDGMKDGTGK